MTKFPLYLVQTDTTAGFLSKDKSLLNAAKKRDLLQPCILCGESFRELGIRVPNKFKKQVRKAKKTTFVISRDTSFRLVKEPPHSLFLRQNGAMYSTSANLTAEAFDIGFATQSADIIVEDFRGLAESAPSKIIQIGQKRARKIR